MGSDVMKSLAWAEKLVLVLSFGLLIGAAGCGKETATVDSGAPATQAPAKFTGVPSELTAKSLTGAWLGKAILDQDKFNNKLAQLNPESRAKAEAMAKSFLSIAMAMEFHANGTLNNEVEVLSAEGKLLHEGSRAVWRVVEAKPNGLMVQIQERRTDGRVATNQMFYQFSGDRNQMAIKTKVGQQLQDCDAMILFERKTLPPTNVAAGSTGTVTK